VVSFTPTGKATRVPTDMQVG